MNVQRLSLRLARPVLRSTFQRRFASDKTELTGVADNAFNRERAAVKAHAAATSGMYMPPTSTQSLFSLTPPQDLWRRLSI